MQRLRIFHETDYQYSTAVRLGAHKILVRPRDGHDIRIEQSKLAISPNAVISWHRDQLDNSVALATFEDIDTDRLTITSEVIVAHYLSDRQYLPVQDHARCFPFTYTTTELSSLSSYFNTIDQSERLRTWLAEKTAGISDTVDLLNLLCSTVHSSFIYEERHEEGVHSPDSILEGGKGSCRDYAWLFVVAARCLGIAARFVSGYFHTAGTALADGSTHAWAEVYLPGAGWTGFDPTSSKMTAENHVPVSVALFPEDVPPVSGHFVGPANMNPLMTVRVNVNPV